MSKISGASIDLAIRTKRNCWTPIKTNRCIDQKICILLSPWLEKLGEQNQDFYNSPSHGAWKNLDFAIVILRFPGRVYSHAHTNTHLRAQARAHIKTHMDTHTPWCGCGPAPTLLSARPFGFSVQLL